MDDLCNSLWEDDTRSFYFSSIKMFSRCFVRSILDVVPILASRHYGNNLNNFYYSDSIIYLDLL